MLAKRGAGGRTWSGEALLFELKHENSDGKTPLEQLSAEALSQAMEKYTDGVLGKWQPKHTLITWRLAIPNLEVETAWITVISRWLKEDIKINEHFTEFGTGIQEVSPRHIERGLSRILRDLASYHDTARNKEEGEDEESRRENFYHGLVLGLLACLSPGLSQNSSLARIRR